MPVRRRQIRLIVERLLFANDIDTAPIDVELLARRLGADVQRQPAGEDLSGFILRNRKKPVIGVNSNHHRNRQRFTIAHEIGHMLLHDRSDDIHVDDRDDCGLPVRKRNQESSKGEDDYEKEANLFAAELLMPATFLEQDITSLEEADLLDEDVLKPLARKYEVSSQALAFRLANLGYVRL